MLGKLQIKCEFQENGCKEVVLLENINTHQFSCVYNPENNLCKTCFTEIEKSGHDCVQSLLEINKKLTTDVDKFKTDYETRNDNSMGRSQEVPNQSLLRELRELRAEKENLLKTIQEISKTEPINSVVNTTVTPPETLEQDMINEALMHLSAPIITRDETTSEIRIRIIALVSAELREQNRMSIVCKNIAEKLNDEFGSIWHCIAAYSQYCYSYLRYETGYRITIQYGKLVLKIYKTQFLDIKSTQQRFRSGKIKPEISIIRFDMCKTMISDVKYYTFSALEKCETLTEIASDIKSRMMSKHRGTWQCFIYAYFGTSAVQHLAGKYLYFKIGELVISVYQTSNDK